MKKSFFAAAIKPQFRQLLFVMVIAFIIGACSKTSTTDIGSPDNSLPAEQQKGPPPPPPSPANPAIVFNADTTFQYRGQSHTASAIYVIDADGTHRKLIYYDFITSGNGWSKGSTADPEWSGNGQQICFTGRVFAGSIPPIRPSTSQTSIYTLNFSLVNGVPTASNVTKILDGAANGVSYSYPSWSPTANEIAVRTWGSNGNPEKLQIVPSTGGTPTTIFTAPTTDYIISSPCFSPDGSKLAFHFRNYPTGEKWIKVIDRFTGTVLNSIVLDPALGWFDLDWSRTSGSSKLIFRSFIPNSGGLGSLYQLDFNSSSTPTALTSNAADPTWSPDDTKIAYRESTNQQGIIKVLTLSTNTIISISTLGGYSLNWKR